MSEELPDLARTLLRSLCMRDINESELAHENFALTRFDVLEMGGVEKRLLDTVRWWYMEYNGAPQISLLTSKARKDGDDDLEIYIEEIRGTEPAWGSSYTYTLDQWADIHGKKRLRAALLETHEIAKTGIEEDGEVEKGLIPAIHRGIQRLTEIEMDLNPVEKPVEMDEGIQQLQEEYLDRKRNPHSSYGLTLGLHEIDTTTRGAMAKELWLIGGFTSQGKSTIALHWARHVAVEMGHHVMIFTLEMDTAQVWRILACGHTHHPKFGRIGLKYDRIKSGTLEEDDEVFYNEALIDLRSCGGYISVTKPGGLTTMADIRARAEVAHRKRPLDMVIIDYLGLVSGPTGNKARMTLADVINRNILDAKQFAMEFDAGEGIVVASPHQLNRQGYRHARENGGVYELDALADANQAERTADYIFTSFIDTPMRQADKAMITILKARDSEVSEPFEVSFPLAHRVIGDRRQDLDALMEPSQ